MGTVNHVKLSRSRENIGNAYRRRYFVEDASLEDDLSSVREEGREERIVRDSTRLRENAPRRLCGRNSHYGMDGRAQEVEIRKRVNWAIPGGTPPGAYARRAWLVNIHIFIPFLLLISSCPVIERNSLMRYKRKQPAARRSSITARRWPA